MKKFYIKKLIFALFVLPLIIDGLNAQHRGATQSTFQHDISMIPMNRWKFYGGVGASLYAGELTGRHLLGSNNLFKSIKPRPAATIGVAYKLTNRFFMKAEVSYCYIKGAESTKTMESFGRKQNYQFRSDNYDLMVMGQYNILPYAYLPYYKMKMIPYVVMGLGITSNRPKGYMNNEWKSLKELSCGQVQNRMLLVLPIGAGVLYRVNNNWDIGLDATIRYTLGGSLDGDSRKGVSTRTLSSEGKTYFNQYYNPNTTTVLRDHKKFNDLYTVLQVRLQYTFIPHKYKQMLKSYYLNHFNYPRGHLR